MCLREGTVSHVGLSVLVTKKADEKMKNSWKDFVGDLGPSYNEKIGKKEKSNHRLQGHYSSGHNRGAEKK